MPGCSKPIQPSCTSQAGCDPSPSAMMELWFAWQRDFELQYNQHHFAAVYLSDSFNCWSWKLKLQVEIGNLGDHPFLKVLQSWKKAGLSGCRPGTPLNIAFSIRHKHFGLNIMRFLYNYLLEILFPLNLWESLIILISHFPSGFLFLLCWKEENCVLWTDICIPCISRW